MSINSIAQNEFTGNNKIRRETLTPKAYNTDPLKVYARRKVEGINEARKLKELDNLENWL